MIVDAASEFPSDIEFQLIAGMFHEDIEDLASATKYLPTRDHFYPGLKKCRYYCACVKLNPKDARGIAAYAGMLHQHLHDDALAERYYREAMKLDLRSSSIIIEYANFLNTSGNSGKAEHYFAMACKVAPFDANAQLALALYLKQSKKYDRARSAFEKVARFYLCVLICS
jgi:Tfp pilus assembly protein PilF